MTTQPENETDEQKTSDKKQELKVTAVAFAKELGKSFSMNAASGLGAGAGIAAGLLIVTKVMARKSVVFVEKAANTGEDNENN